MRGEKLCEAFSNDRVCLQSDPQGIYPAGIVLTSVDNNSVADSKEKILSYNICTGKKPATSSAFDNVEECSEHLNNQRLGLLTISDYVYASIDPNCKTITSKSCQNYNYLAIKSEWWLATADSADTVSVYQVNRSGAVKSTSAGSYATVRPVIYLNNKVLYKSGNGSLEKPYKVR